MKFHSKVESLRCEGGIFDVEPNELDLNVGKKCRFKNPQCGAEQGEGVIGGVQKNHWGKVCYRVVMDSDTQKFGRSAATSAIEIIE